MKGVFDAVTLSKELIKTVSEQSKLSLPSLLSLQKNRWMPYLFAACMRSAGAPLTAGEIAMASLLFRDVIDYTRVRIHGNPPTKKRV